MGAAIDAIRSYFTLPAVWLSGIVAALGILASYYAFRYLHPTAGLAISALVIVMLPFFFAGTYGMILDGNKKKGAFMIYARFGYPRCLTPALFLILIVLVLCTLFNFLGLIIAIPILFFTYFADITAIRHNLRAGQAIVDSARRVNAGMFPMIIFYLGNIIAVLFISLIMDLIISGFISVLAADTITALTELSKTLMGNPALFTNQTLMLELGKQLIASPGVIESFIYTAALSALLFVPFFIAYKAYFFKGLLAAQAEVAAMQKAREAEYAASQSQTDENGTGNSTNNGTSADNSVERTTDTNNPQVILPQNRQIPDPHAGEDGEYDEKGRWFKYK